ncbi:hypothetical protein HDV02_004558 [Globomyces sp. JEL0801]|nr:hypothetical protein HDV02_004558 [Globomyces sp. JEL0801]
MNATVMKSLTVSIILPILFNVHQSVHPTILLQPAYVTSVIDNPDGFKKCIVTAMAYGAAPAIAACAFAGAQTLGVTCAISALAIGGAAAGCVISEC